MEDRTGCSTMMVACTAGDQDGLYIYNETDSEAHFLHSLKGHRLETFQTRHLRTSLALIPYEGKGHPAGDGRWR